MLCIVVEGRTRTSLEVMNSEGMPFMEAVMEDMISLVNLSFDNFVLTRGLCMSVFTINNPKAQTYMQSSPLVRLLSAQYFFANPCISASMRKLLPGKAITSSIVLCRK